MPFWVTFAKPVQHDGKTIRSVSVDTRGNAERARVVASALGEVATVERLPYPADPRLNDETDPQDKDGRCPSFCYAPRECKGRSACPQNYACSE